MQIEAGTIVPNLIFGIILVGAGLFVTRNRRRVNAWVYKEQQRHVGQKVADISAGKQTPFMMGVVGVFISFVGVAMLVGAVIGIVQLGA